MAAAHVFVDDLAQPVVSDDDRHHLQRVLRLRAGEVVTVSDGLGGVRTCVVGASFDLEPVSDIVRHSRPAPAVEVGFALVKGERPEWVVQKLTECGVDRIVPFIAARTVVRWDPDKAARNLERLQKVAREAAMQSRRVWLPRLEEVAPVADLLAPRTDVGATRPVLADIDGEAPSLAAPFVLVGPEGGWTDAERGAAARVRLGDGVFRAETAAIAAGVLLTGLRARLVRAVIDA